MSRRKGLSPEEIEYIRQNCLSSTDEEIAKHLNRDIRTISSARNKLGIKKDRGGRVRAIDKD
jgi:DNA-binding CsgD family transcriptional regulator